MVDFVKVIVKECNISFIETHPDLNFVGSYYCETGEAIPRKKAIYKGLDFVLYDTGLLRIQGSLHKYKNGGVHNYDDFTIKQVVEVLNDLSAKFQISLSDCVLRNFETGINIIPDINPKKLLNRLLIHKNVAFKDVSRKAGHIKKSEHSQYIFKIYDKGLQYGLSYDCLRIELKFTRMQKLNQIGLVNLNDLLRPQIYTELQKMLLAEWSNILLFELPKDDNRLTRIIRDRKQYQWRNQEYWENLTKQERCRQRKRYETYVEKYTRKEQALITGLIKSKTDELIKK